MGYNAANGRTLVILQSILFQKPLKILCFFGFVFVFYKYVGVGRGILNL